MVLLAASRSRTCATLRAIVSRVLAESEKASESASASPLDRYCSVIVSTCREEAMAVTARVTETATSSMAAPSLGRTFSLLVAAILFAVLVEVLPRGRPRLEREVRGRLLAGLQLHLRAAGLVDRRPRHQRVDARREIVHLEGRVGAHLHDAGAGRQHQDLGAHLRMDVAIHVHLARRLELHGLLQPTAVQPQVEAGAVRRGKDVVIDVVAV